MIPNVIEGSSQDCYILVPIGIENQLRIRNVLSADVHLMRLVGNLGWLYSAGAISTVLLASQGVIAARVLGAERYGLFAAILAAAQLISQFLDFRTWEVLTNYLPGMLLNGNGSVARGLVRLGILIDLAAGGLSLVLTWGLSSLIIQNIVHNSDVRDAVMLIAISLPFTMVANGSVAGVLRVQNRFAWMSAKSVILATFRLVLMVGLFAAGLDLYALVWTYTAGEAVNAIATSLLARAATREVVETEASPVGPIDVLQRVPGLTHLLVQTWISGTLKGFHSRVDVLVLSLLSTPVQVGYYRIALDLASIISKFSSPLQAAVMPELAKLSANKASMRGIVERISLLLAVILLPLALVFSVVADRVVDLALGSGYAGTASSLIVLVWGYGVALMLVWVRPAAVVKGRVGFMNIVALVVALLQVILLSVLVPSNGALGAAWTTAIVYALVPILTLLGLVNGQQEKPRFDLPSP